LAEAEGIEPGTDAYFDYLNKGLGYSKAEAAAEESVIVETAPKAAPAKQAEAPRVAAPVSRGGIQAGSDGKVRIHLNSAQKEIADSLGMSYSRYGLQMLKLQQSARDPNYAGPRFHEGS
jgi:hypothetical protein